MPLPLCVHQDDGASGAVWQFAHVSYSQQDIYRNDEDEDEGKFARMRQATLIGKSERESLVARDRVFFKDLFRLGRSAIGEEHKMVSLELGRSTTDA